MKIIRNMLLLFIIMILIAGCTENNSDQPNKIELDNNKTIEANVIFRARNEVDDRPISDVNILVIEQNGEVIDRLVTDDKGEAEQTLTVSLDPKYDLGEQQDFPLRGTVTVIASREGYRDAVILEVPISDGSAAQPFQMQPIVSDQRNEPTVQLGNNHRLEIISLVDKYVER